MTNPAMQQANTLVTTLGLIKEVLTYVQNEQGHIYGLKSGVRLVVTGPYSYHYLLKKEDTEVLEMGEITPSLKPLGVVEDYPYYVLGLDDAPQF